MLVWGGGNIIALSSLTQAFTSEIIATINTSEDGSD